MISYVLSKVISMCMGLLYPAYCSYKAVKTKNVKEYVHWMMYWIVFSLFSFFEVFVDIFIGCWFPFYYELKIVFILWMLSPQTRGGSVLYRRIIHPMFTRHEPEIDAYLADFKLHASNLVVRWGTSCFNCITEWVMTAILRSDITFIKQKKGSFSIEGFDQQDMNRNTQRPREDNDAMLFSDNEMIGSPEDENRQQRRIDRLGSVEHDMNRYNGLPKPYSMMNLGTTETDAQPPKNRSSSRKKKEFGNYTVVTSQDMAMPLVFGWYPPPSVAPDMNTASVYIQPSMLPPLVPPPQSIENPILEVARSETMDTFYSSDDDDDVDVDDNESDEEEEDNDVMESETDNFFDCEMETDEIARAQGDNQVAGSSSANIQPSVQLVSKRSLQKFETDSKDGGSAPQPQARLRRSTRSNERETKRSSMSAMQSKSGLASGSDHKSKVKKSLSNNDLKLVKPTSIWSTSPFRRVLGPFSSSPPKAPSPSNLKRSGSTASRASLNSEKKRKSESKGET